MKPKETAKDKYIFDDQRVPNADQYFRYFVVCSGLY